MAFEFVEMDLDERARLRKLLLELGGLPMMAQVTNRTRRRGRVAMHEELIQSSSKLRRQASCYLPVTCPSQL